MAEISFAVLYVVVVLMAARFCRARTLVLVAFGCVCLTVVSYIFTSGGWAVQGLVNTVISLTAILLTTILGLQGQKVAASLEERANLLDRTHDAIFVRSINNDIITYWNRGAQELYGWRAEEAIGKKAHQLLKTNFQVPMDELRAELARAGRWEGELSQAWSDGTKAVVVSRWSLQRDDQERLLAILETNNDITERKHREEEITRLNMYLAQAQRLSRTGSFGWSPSSRKIYWSDETYRIFECEPGTRPTVELVINRMHPEAGCICGKSSTAPQVRERNSRPSIA